jgi:hypothetical protein
MISFFNDVDMASPEPWLPAVQFAGARGQFSGYDALPPDPAERTRVLAACTKRWRDAEASGGDQWNGIGPGPRSL